MSRSDHQVLFTALGFTAVIIQGEAGKTKGARRAIELAKLIEEFCALNLPSISSVNTTSEAGVDEIDSIIDKHKSELRRKEETVLPTDKETLLKLYDRLQVRKIHRTQRDFYAVATAGKLADLILHFLDEEISDAEALS